jgi:transcriptional regulator with XRE-family HTH domain
MTPKNQEDKSRDLHALGIRIERARNELRLTQEQLAENARTTPKIIRKIIQGEKVIERILLAVCSELGVDPDDDRIGDYADADHGHYALSDLKDYVGNFQAFRRSLRFPKYILRSGFKIFWDPKEKILRFNEFQKYASIQDGKEVDRSQSGEVFVGSHAGLFHFLTKSRGALRLITVSKYRLRNPTDLIMRGIVLTQAAGENGHKPSAAAIVFEKIKISDAELRNHAKEFNSSDVREIDLELTEVERHVVNFVLAPPPELPKI